LVIPAGPLKLIFALGHTVLLPVMVQDNWAGSTMVFPVHATEQPTLPVLVAVTVYVPAPSPVKMPVVLLAEAEPEST
jgi:hypothetical protein